ncbi:hypothetical protein K490DRAFT_45245 [Saccharata proteae CBS 121410]|uniref:Pre-rRNA processing protein n=1 Tax=Saccharata proteae CBS 121410 TaxID=1314787 RepID=A0A9P4HSQ0_9PEZI|nr:hypothetical protein K490DRAFT_45245 [Saccharata proteae CBS 121410]
MILGFFAPQAVEEYAQEAIVFKPTGLQFEAFSPSGVSVRIQGDFSMDAARVQKKSVRDFGRFGTWIAREVESDRSHVEVILPGYGDKVLGTAEIPGIRVDIRNGHTTHVDFAAALRPGSLDSVRDIANDWLEGRLTQLEVKGKADVPLRSGIIHLGTQTIEHAMVFEGNAIPSIPAYDIGKLNIHEITIPDGRKGLQADVSLAVANDYPIEMTLPPLGFGILVDNCAPGDPMIMVADATTAELSIKPYEDVHLNVTGIVRLLPDALMTTCPGSKKSPLDLFLGQYVHGEDAKVYVRGSDSPSTRTPKWMTELMSDITVPVSFPGHAPQHFLKNFSLADVHFHLPGLLAEPGTPEAQPSISANIKALVGLPKEMNFPLDVSRVKADADIFYHGKKFGKLDISKWQPANSTRAVAHGKKQADLEVDSHVKEAPLTITDDDVFTKVVQALLLGSETLVLSVKADVGVIMETALGKFAVQNIPAEGVVPVKPIGIGGGSFGKLAPKVGNLKILGTGLNSLTLSAEANFTNPTKYSATVPYVDINILTNGTILGHATAKDIVVVPGNNTKVPIVAIWDPLTASGPEGKRVGIELLSQYISGFNTTLTLQTHVDSVPAQPALGRALSGLSIDFPTPRLGSPSKPGDGDGDGGGDDDGGPHFIKDATMHLITSSAIFTLASPLASSTLYITYINATAFYHEDAVGKILYDLPFAVPPGESTSPRLPVDWSLGSVGYEAVRKALGGALRLKARATVGIKVGRFEERVWFHGRGIGAHVRL